MTTLKLLREASEHPMECKCGSKNTHLEFADKTKQGLPKSYRVCDDCGARVNITGPAKKKHGVTY